MPKLYQSLQLRLLTSIVIATLFFALIAAGLAYRLGFERAIRNGRAGLEGLITAVEKTAAIGAYTADGVLLQEIVDGLARNPIGTYVDIRSAQGVVLASKQTGSAGLSAWATSAGQVERRLASPFDSAETVGSLRIMTDMAKLQALAKEEATVLAAVMIVQTLLIALLVYLLAARFVSRPIVKLAHNLREMEPGTSRRIKVLPMHDADEIGTLVDGANALLHANELALRRERELRNEVEQIQAEYRQIFTASSAGIFVLHADGGLINCNPTLLRIAGLTAADPTHFKGLDLVHEIFSKPDMVKSMMLKAATSGETVAADLQLRPQGGTSRWVHCLFSVQSPELGSPTPDAQGLIEGVLYDITERKKSELDILHQAEHDDLTGLKNRVTSERIVDRFLEAATHSSSAVSLLYIDLDGFKPVNDVNGHKAGDQVLAESALRMRAAVRRSTDLVGRVGGDEFLIALNHVGPDDARLNDVAQSVVAALRQPFELEDGQHVHIGVSIGIASYPQHGSNRMALMEQADIAMYEVKRTGKNNFALALTEARGDRTLK
jgi:diguanylate cyclase (GGDEF)-like protein/PAS domain S-box-containing protein